MGVALEPARPPGVVMAGPGCLHTCWAPDEGERGWDQSRFRSCRGAALPWPLALLSGLLSTGKSWGSRMRGEEGGKPRAEKWQWS